MSNCLFTTPYRMPALIGLLAGVALGLLFKYTTALRNPRNPDVDDRMGWAILAGCALIGSTAGLLVQIYLYGECGTGRPW